MGQATKLTAVVLLAGCVLLSVFALSNRAIRTETKVLLGLEAPPQITPLQVVVPSPMAATSRPTRAPAPVTATAIASVAGRATATGSAGPTVLADPTETPRPPAPTPAQVV